MLSYWVYCKLVEYKNQPSQPWDEPSNGTICSRIHGFDHNKSCSPSCFASCFASCSQSERAFPPVGRLFWTIVRQ